MLDIIVALKKIEQIIIKKDNRSTSECALEFRSACTWWQCKFFANLLSIQILSGILFGF